MSFPLALAVTLLLLIGSGFFVAAEFALVAAKRHRMERAAAQGQRGAKAALAGMRELSLMLAGAQLGITICTLGLGSISKPAISHEIDPLLEKLGLPSALSYGIAFAIAMTVVVFLHMVLGEMAPKSWAIAHPERSAMLLAPPFRALIRLVRPLIWVLNKVSNALVRLCRVTPRDEITSVHASGRARLWSPPFGASAPPQPRQQIWLDHSPSRRACENAQRGVLPPPLRHQAHVSPVQQRLGWTGPDFEARKRPTGGPGW